VTIPVDETGMELVVAGLELAGPAEVKHSFWYRVTKL
jgi:hypothetical protein